MGLVKAKIEILDQEAIDDARGLKKSMEVQFNPTEYTIQKGAQIAEVNIPGLDSPILQFVRGQNRKLTLDLFFDTTRPDTQSAVLGNEAKDVNDLTRPFYELVRIQPKTHAPPRIRFSWKSLQFEAIVESVQQKFTLFNEEGAPLRATLTVTFREYKTVDQQVKEFNWQSPDHSKRYVVKQGDTLSRIAAAEYQDASFWRLIADENNIETPRAITPGTELLLPPIDSIGQPIRAS